MEVKFINGKYSKEITSALEQAMSDDLKPTLAIAFVAHVQDNDQ